MFFDNIYLIQGIFRYFYYCKYSYIYPVLPEEPQFFHLNSILSIGVIKNFVWIF